ncbi:MAG TPA: hypothetical protein VLC91_10750 [Spongiibacteraceae bacterium]|nr:hypothetical protein [Spongiibacteraceae bacterium]
MPCLAAIGQLALLDAVNTVALGTPHEQIRIGANGIAGDKIEQLSTRSQPIA